MGAMLWRLRCDLKRWFTGVERVMEQGRDMCRDGANIRLTSADFLFCQNGHYGNKYENCNLPISCNVIPYTLLLNIVLKVFSPHIFTLLTFSSEYQSLNTTTTRGLLFISKQLIQYFMTDPRCFLLMGSIRKHPGVSKWYLSEMV